MPEVTRTDRRVRSLYLCYFGIEQPLVQTQVLPYLRELRARGVDASLLTFEAKPDGAWRRDVEPAWRARLDADGLAWEWLPYHKWPTIPATAYDIVRGAWRARVIARRERTDILHARSHVACVMGALVKRVTGARLLFDIRGLMAEEYVDGGVWPAGGVLFRCTKRVERMLLDTADGFVVLTARGRDALFGPASAARADARPIEVIPTCVDLRRFTLPDADARRAAKARLGFEGCRVIAQVGAIDGWVPTSTLAEVIAAACRRDASAVALVLTSRPDAKLRRELHARGIGEDRYVIRTASADAVPSYLHATDVGLAIYKPGYAKVCSSPTKVAEYLASGVPIIASGDVGDVDAQIAEDRTGVVLSSSDPSAIERAWTEMEALERDLDTPRRCRRSAEERFHLQDVAGVRYRRVYRRVLERDT
jgi:glycosyltransferase involved in cell wall biosynthesis